MLKSGGGIMANSIEAHCRACNENTSFTYDGYSWECNSCGAYNTQGNSYDPELPYGNDD